MSTLTKGPFALCSRLYTAVVLQLVVQPAVKSKHHVSMVVVMRQNVAGRFNIYSQLVISAIRIADINNSK